MYTHNFRKVILNNKTGVSLFISGGEGRHARAYQ
jgi:hypothetical protein